MFKASKYFNKENRYFELLFEGEEYVWNGLKNLKSAIKKTINPNTANIKKTGFMVSATTELKNSAVIHAGAFLKSDMIEIGPGAVIEPGAFIDGPTVIGKNTQVRHSAYIRGNVLSGENCVIGHATEVKNSALLGESKAGHFAYIGDSIIGSVNLGAGTKLANLKLTQENVYLKTSGKNIDTGLRKIGAIMADGCETGCNSVTSPGTIMAKNVLLYPNTTARGYYEEGTIIKLRQEVEKARKEK